MKPITNNNEPIHDYAGQFAIINCLLSDKTSFARCRNIIREEYFDSGLMPVVKFILEYADKYSDVPVPIQVMAETGKEFELVEGVDSAWLLDRVEKFCRYRAIENVILNGPDLLSKGAHAEIETQIKDAMTISLITDLGADYFRSAKDRIDRLKNRDNMVSTGWREIDRRLYGGFTKGSLNIYCGSSGSGKSLFLQNSALNWAFMGMNVIYITLELSEDLVGNRIDSMVTSLSTKEIFARADEVCFTIENVRQKKKPGSFHIKKMAEAGTTCNDIRAYLKEYQIKTGVRPDALLIDYLDLVYPNNQKLDVTNAFAKDKHVSEEMRALGGEWDMPVVTASQLNRSAIEAQEFDQSHIAGGISKINTADNVFAIRTTQSMREAGRYGLEFLKTRSAAAVGSKCDLAYDIKTMRITDPEDADDRSDDEIEDTKARDRSTGTVVAGAASTVVESATKSKLNDLFNTLRQ